MRDDILCEDIEMMPDFCTYSRISVRGELNGIFFTAVD
jgi:hypothetical protein